MRYIKLCKYFLYYVNIKFKLKDGTLNDIIKEHRMKNESIPEEKIQFWSIQLLKGIDFLHSIQIWHRDIKPENIFMHNNRKRLVLGDLGLAKDLNLNKSLSSFTTVGTVYYKAPEFFNHDSNINYSEKIDIWYLLYFNGTIKFTFD